MIRMRPPFTPLPSRTMVYLQFDGEPIQHYRERMGSTTAGFWVKGNNIYPVDETHISAIMDNPELFGISAEFIDATFEKYGERRRSEGKAREEIIRTVAKSGWVRVRHYTTRGSDYWSIQVDVIRTRRRVIEDAVMSLIEHGHMTLHDDLQILGYDCGTKLVHGYKDGGVKEYVRATRAHSANLALSRSYSMPTVKLTVEESSLRRTGLIRHRD